MIGKYPRENFRLKFNPGDRVRVYGITNAEGWWDERKGKIIALESNGTLLVEMESGYNSKTPIRGQCHPKQVRKLRAKKSQEITRTILRTAWETTVDDPYSTKSLYHEFINAAETLNGRKLNP